jgi:hypothetical protein
VTRLPARACLSALALAVALFPVAAKPADAATKKHHRHHHAAKGTVHPQRATAETVTPAPAATPAPAVTSVISIGGYVFYNLTYAQAVAAYQAQLAAAPAGATPPPVTSVSVTTTVGGTA